MKKSILISLVFAALAGVAQARPGDHCRWQDNRCSQNYLRSEAYRALLNAEGGRTVDAESDLRFIESLSQETGTSLEATVGNFLYVLNMVGGSAFTEETQRVMRVVAPYVNRHMQLAEAIDVFEGLNQAEGGRLNDAIADMQLVMDQERFHHADYRENLYIFKSILNLVGGSAFTEEATRAFRIVLGNAGRFSSSEIFAAFSEIWNAEGGRLNDVLSDLNLVVRAGEQCGLQDAVHEFLTTLNSLGGSAYTEEAQRTFRLLFRL